jgi:hypothetical protein
MIWDSSKSHDTHPPRQQQESYYQKLLPNHIIAHLLHPDQDQKQAADPGTETGASALID